MPKKISITPQEFQEKHARRLKAAIPDIQAGIAKVTESPTLKAAAKQDKMKNNLNAAIDSGKWAAGLRRVDVTAWKQAFTDKGVGRIAQGIDGAKDKVTNFATQLLAHEAALQTKVQSMNDMTLEDSKARAVAWIDGMSKFRRQ